MSDIVWRYVRNGKVRHALLADRRRYAVCGFGPSWYVPDGWLGISSVLQRDRVATLPACRRCVAMGAQP